MLPLVGTNNNRSRMAPSKAEKQRVLRTVSSQTYTKQEAKYLLEQLEGKNNVNDSKLDRNADASSKFKYLTDSVDALRKLNQHRNPVSNILSKFIRMDTLSYTVAKRELQKIKGMGSGTEKIVNYTNCRDAFSKLLDSACDGGVKLTSAEFNGILTNISSLSAQKIESLNKVHLANIQPAQRIRVIREFQELANDHGNKILLRRFVVKNLKILSVENEKETRAFIVDFFCNASNHNSLSKEEYTTEMVGLLHFLTGIGDEGEKCATTLFSYVVRNHNIFSRDKLKEIDKDVFEKLVNMLIDHYDNANELCALLSFVKDGYQAHHLDDGLHSKLHGKILNFARSKSNEGEAIEDKVIMIVADNLDKLETNDAELIFRINSPQFSKLTISKLINKCTISSGLATEKRRILFSLIIKSLNNINVDRIMIQQICNFLNNDPMRGNSALAEQTDSTLRTLIEFLDSVVSDYPLHSGVVASVVKAIDNLLTSGVIANTKEDNSKSLQRLSDSSTFSTVDCVNIINHLDSLEDAALTLVFSNLSTLGKKIVINELRIKFLDKLKNVLDGTKLEISVIYKLLDGIKHIIATQVALDKFQGIVENTSKLNNNASYLESILKNMPVGLNTTSITQFIEGRLSSFKKPQGMHEMDAATSGEEELPVSVDEVDSVSGDDRQAIEEISAFITELRSSKGVDEYMGGSKTKTSGEVLSFLTNKVFAGGRNILQQSADLQRNLLIMIKDNPAYYCVPILEEFAKNLKKFVSKGAQVAIGKMLRSGYYIKASIDNEEIRGLVLAYLDSIEYSEENENSSSVFLGADITKLKEMYSSIDALRSEFNALPISDKYKTQELIADVDKKYVDDINKYKFEDKIREIFKEMKAGGQTKLSFSHEAYILSNIVIVDEYKDTKIMTLLARNLDKFTFGTIDKLERQAMGKELTEKDAEIIREKIAADLSDITCFFNRLVEIGKENEFVKSRLQKYKEDMMKNSKITGRLLQTLLMSLNPEPVIPNEEDDSLSSIPKAIDPNNVNIEVLDDCLVLKEAPGGVIVPKKSSTARFRGFFSRRTG